jgi:hypothetical protein
LEFEKVCESLDDEAMIALANGCPNMITLYCCGLTRVTDKAFIAMAHAFSKIICLELGRAALITDTAVRVCSSISKSSIFAGGLLSIIDRCFSASVTLLRSIGALSLEVGQRKLMTNWRKWSVQSGRQVSAKADFYD